MGLTSSLFAGLSGMKTNEFSMDVIGNNIANVNTVAYKTDRVTFQSQFSQTFSFGSAPSNSIGGTNPLQVGTGAQVGAMSRDFSMGAPEFTGIKTDMAIQGQGLFILERADGSTIFSRDGSFHFNSQNFLVSSQGFYLQGYGVDNNFNLVEGTLTRLQIPVGEITTASVSTFASFAGNLDANDDIKSVRELATDAMASGDLNSVPRSILTSQVFYNDALGTVPAAGTDLLTTIYQNTGTPQKMFEVGNKITMGEANKGGETLGSLEFEVTAASTLDDLRLWIQNALGITTLTDDPNLIDLDDISGTNNLVAQGLTFNPGVYIDDGSVIAGDNGRIRIVGNIGHENNIILGSSAFTIAQGTAATAPTSTTVFSFTHNPSQGATTDALRSRMGDSVRTSYNAFDSLGNPINVKVTLVKENTSSAGTVWRFFAESENDVADSDSDGVADTHKRAIGTGQITFDAEGNYVSGDQLNITIDLFGSGATSPQTITLDFSAMDSFNLVSAISLQAQDGFPAGTLQDFSVGDDGVIVGSFDNGLTRTLGQVILATFRNYEGLVAQGENLFIGGPNSGNAIVRKPLELGTGSITPSALELSNVDLSREFINLIISSTGFSASSRVIQTADRLLNELIALGR